MHYIQVLAFLLFFQSFTACQQAPDTAVPLATADMQLVSISPRDLINPKMPATDIIFQSTDIGQTWQDISAGLPADKSVDCLIQNGEIILSNSNGVYRGKSTSAAPVWAKEFMLSNPVFGMFPGRTGPYALGTGNSFMQNITKDTWIPVFSTFKNQMIRTVFESLDGAVFIGTDNGLFKSTDQGKTWKHVHTDGWVICMAESNGVLICTNQRGILRSTDGGEHWDVVVSEGGVGIQVEVIGGGFAAITYNTESETRRIRISNDGGKTWEPIDANLPPSADIASIKQVGQYFFCGHPDGVFRSSDGGTTWELVFPAIGKKVFNLYISGDVLYAIPRDAGC